MGAAEAKAAILANKTALGIEFGSTRIKAVLVDDKISQSHLAVMNGKIVMKTVSGRIALMISGQAFRTVIRIWQGM